MGTSFRAYQPDQSYLLPPSPRDWLPEGHLAFFVMETVAALDLSALYQRYEGDGRRNQPYDPRMMVAVLLYAYATGTFSSRKIARKLHEDVAYRVISGESFPAHRTLCDFRHDHLECFLDLFTQVVRIAREAGMVKLGSVAIDGSKVKANASKRKAMSYGRMKTEELRLREQIRELAKRADREDAKEDAVYGQDRTGDELPQEIQRREDRLRVIQEAKARIEARQEAEDRSKGRDPDQEGGSGSSGRRSKRRFGEPEDKKQDNFTDPESRIMKTPNGFEQCYNGQIAVDESSHLIVATRVTQNGSDVGELIGVVDQVVAVVGEPPKQVLADAGYRSEANLVEMETRKIEAYVSLGREGKQIPQASSENPATGRMAEKLRTVEGQRRYGRRKGTVEPAFGWIKQALGFRQFSVRGLDKVRGEWELVCLAVNLKRLHRLAVA